jgi:methyl-accepting chemotaxis protein
MFADLRLRDKLLVSYGAVALLVVVVGLLGMRTAASMHGDSVSLFEEEVLPLEHLGGARTYVDRLWADCHRYLLAPADRPRMDEEIAQSIAQVQSEMDAFREAPIAAEEREWLVQFDQGWATYREAVASVTRLARTGRQEEALALLLDGHAGRDARNAVRDNLERLSLAQVRGADELRRSTEEHYTRSSYTLIAVGLLAVAVAVGLGVVVARSIAGPMRRVVAVIDGLSRGSLESSLADDGRQDEIGHLTRAAVAIAASLNRLIADLRQMTDAVEAGMLSFRLDAREHHGEYAVLLNGMNQLVTTLCRPLGEVAEVMQRMAGGDVQGRMVGAYEGELRAMRTNVNRSFDAIASLLGELGGMAGRLAQGDLRLELKGTYQGDFAVLHANMNAAVGQLRTALAAIAGSTEEIAVAAAQTSAASGDVANKTAKQIAMLAEVTRVISETAASVREVSHNAGRGDALARDTAVQAEAGQAQLGRLVESVERIATGNARVAQISDRISRIADKTHILALNAGIEAARAGQYGAGFAIVAQQIGRLAEDASAAVTDISQLTVESGQLVTEGVGAAAAAKRAMEGISRSAHESEQATAAIATAILQQSDAVQQLSARVAQVEAAGESNAAAATEIDATMEGLSHRIRQTADHLGKFSLA